ncbi:hypothetical protein HDU92_007485, partial [Lobulomyces angularis]
MKFLVIFSALILALNAASVQRVDWCGTRSFSNKLDQEVSQSFGNPSAAKTQKFKVTTYFNIITGTDGGNTVGDVSNKIVQKQMKVLNSAFSKSGFEFNLDSVTRTSNNAWYNHYYGTAEEFDMKNNLRQGDAADLNIYVSTLP